VRQSDTELLSNLNRALAAIVANGTYDEIRGQYFDFDIMTTPKTATELYK
jgi:polar amino acid transport system substrate-binding protein